MLERNTYITSKALWNFLSASVMTSLSGQLAVTTDAVIVSHMIGPDAISAINVVMPLTMLFSCASILIGLGASVLVAKAIGDHDNERVSRIFTIALMLLIITGMAVSAAAYLYCGDIVNAICDDARIHPLALRYAEVITASAFFLILSNGINYFVTTDGSPSLVARGVMTAAIANIVLDVLFVHLWGIEGSAFATAAHYVVALAVVSTHFFKKSSSYRLVNPFKEFLTHTARNLYEGLPLMLGNLILGSAVFIINSMILCATGADGMYIWSVCIQMLMITFVILNGVGNAMLSIGGVLVGEKDYEGVRMLTGHTMKLVCGTLAAFVLFILLFPGILAGMFGADSGGINVQVETPMRIFSLLLIPFAVTLTMRFLFQILEYRILSLLLSVGQLIGIILCLWIFIELAPSLLWWSFPASAIVLMALQLAATFAISREKSGISPVTLIPYGSGNEHTKSFSVPYNKGSIGMVIAEIKEFLRAHSIPHANIEETASLCGSVMDSLIGEGETKKRCFDIHMRLNGEHTHIVLRDAGKRLVPAPTSNESRIEYKYMYGQNVLFMKC